MKAGLNRKQQAAACRGIMDEQYTDLCAQLRMTWETGVTRPLAWRKKQLKSLKRLVNDNEKILLQALKDDLGKHPMEGWKTELSYITGDIDHNLKHLRRWSVPRKVPTPLVSQPGQSYIEPEPLGLVLIISAWNYPIQLCLAPLVAALAAGNTAIIKPSEVAESSSALLAELVPQYLDPDAVAVVTGGVEETTALLKQPFDHILYTGNGQVARIVMEAAAKRLTPVTLELGGKSPVFVDDCVPLAITAQRLAWGKWLNNGQTCIAPDYLMTTERMAGPLIDALATQIHVMYGDDPKTSDSYGRIISTRHTKRLASYLHEKASSQITIVGGEVDIEARYMAPTIVRTQDWDSPLMQEEIFGPILPVLVVKDLDEAIRRVKGRDKPLAAYLFSKSEAKQARWIKEVPCGSQCINDVLMFSTVPDLPFGGVGPSGMGQYSGQTGFENFSHMKAVLRRSWMKDLPIRFAPYNNSKFAWLRRVR